MGREILRARCRRRTWRSFSGFDAFDRRDQAEYGALLAPDIEWHSILAPLLGVESIRGREAVLKYVFESLVAEFEDFRVTDIEEMAPLGADAVLVVARYEGRGRSSGAQASQRVVSIYEVRAGLIAVERDYKTRQEALEAVGLSE